jgi:hypothetical protein
MPCLLFSPIGEALVFVREAQHLVFGQPVMHLVPEGADFPGSITPTLLLAVVGLHSANPYAQPVGDSVMAVTDGGCRERRLGYWPEDGRERFATTRGPIWLGIKIAPQHASLPQRAIVVDTVAGAGFRRAGIPQKRHFHTGRSSSSLITGDRAMLSKSICFMLAGLLVVVPLWILMSYGITADGRPSSPKILIGMTFCFVVGVFWLYEDLKDLLRTR